MINPLHDSTGLSIWSSLLCSSTSSREQSQRRTVDATVADTGSHWRRIANTVLALSCQPKCPAVRSPGPEARGQHR
eukprot:356258-Chlamydomonas_euryale.AAC.8